MAKQELDFIPTGTDQSSQASPAELDFIPTNPSEGQASDYSGLDFVPTDSPSRLDDLTCVPGDTAQA